MSVFGVSNHRLQKRLNRGVNILLQGLAPSKTLHNKVAQEFPERAFKRLSDLTIGPEWPSFFRYTKPAPGGYERRLQRVLDKILLNGKAP